MCLIHPFLPLDGSTMNAGALKNQTIPNPVLGMLIFIGVEIMFFTGFISSLLVIRSQELVWPPFGQPRLPVEATAFSTLVLLLSGIALFRAGRSFVSPSPAGKTQRMIGISFLLGAVFLLLQGYEWVRLIGFGLTASSSLYGGIFYLIIGAHALHVTGALCFLAYIWSKAQNAKGEGINEAAFTAARYFWYFVVGIWPILYFLVYLL